MLDDKELNERVERLQWEVAQLRKKLERLAETVEVLDRNIRLFYQSTELAS